MHRRTASGPVNDSVSIDVMYVTLQAEMIQIQEVKVGVFC